MSQLQLLNALMNLVAPALFIAVALALATRLLMRRRSGAPGLLAQTAINFLVGVAVLVGGLAVFGHDGMMWTYAALVLACGTGQWLLVGGARR